MSTVRLDPAVHPVSVAAFGSGHILVVSVDKLNQRAHLLVVDESGRQLSELRLFDQDYGATLGLGPDSSSPGKQGYLTRMMAAAQMLPAGDNVLIVPIRTKLPLLEINEHGLVRSTPISLPKGKTLSAALPSDDGVLHMLLGHSSDDAYAVSDEESRNGKATAYQNDRYIYDFNPRDGSILDRIDVRKELIPLRKSGRDFILLTTRPEDGRLQMVKGSLAR